jgi:hypothetical protein
MSHKHPRYSYSKDSNGCQDHWVIFDTKTGKDLAYSIFWDSAPDWMRRTEADIRLIVDALNAYPPALRRRARP